MSFTIWNNRVRREGTANLTAAARQAGVGRMVVQSMATLYRPEGGPIKAERDPLWTDAGGLDSKPSHPLRPRQGRKGISSSGTRLAPLLLPPFYFAPPTHLVAERVE